MFCPAKLFDYFDIVHVCISFVVNLIFVLSTVDIQAFTYWMIEYCEEWIWLTEKSNSAIPELRMWQNLRITGPYKHVITINITRTTTHVGVLKQLNFPSSLKGLLSSAVSFYETSAFNSYLYSNVDFLIVAYRNKTNNSFYMFMYLYHQK